MKTKISIAVTGIKHVESPQAGYGIARSLKELGYEVIGIDDSPLISAIVNDNFYKVYKVNALIMEDKLEFLKQLKKIVEVDKIKVLIPSSDREIFFFLSIQKEIEKLGIKLLIPSLDSLKQASKPLLVNLNKKGLSAADSLVVKNKNDILSAAKRLGFPLVCKGLLKDVYMAENLAEAKIYFNIIRERWGGGEGSVVFQKFIAGEPYCICGLANKKSDLLSLICLKKLGIDSKGSTWSGVSIFDSKLFKIAQKFVKETKWIGPFEIEVLRTYKGQKDYIFEINPRFPAWIYFSKIAGLDLSKKLVQILINNDSKKEFDYKENIAYIRESYEKEVNLERIIEFKKKGVMKV